MAGPGAVGLGVLGTAVLGVAVLGTAVLQHQYEITLNTALVHAAPSHTAAQTIESHATSRWLTHMEYLGVAVLGVGVLGVAVLGTAVLGIAVLGTAVLGTAVLGTAVLGTAVLGTAVLQPQTRSLPTQHCFTRLSTKTTQQRASQTIESHATS